MKAYLIDPAIERMVEAAMEHGELNSSLALPPDNIRDILARFTRKMDKTETAVVMASAGARYFVRQIVETALPNLTVLSHNEIPSEVTVRSRGIIE